MATNFIVTSLPEYVQTNRDLLIKNFGLLGSATRQRISIQTGVKKSAYINYLDVAPVFQDGSSCGFAAAGDATLSQREIETAAIKVNMEFCEMNLRGTYAEYLIRVNASDESFPFEQYVADALVAGINEKIEKLIWQGDKALTSNTDLKWIDGFLKLAGEESSVVDVALSADDAAYEAIKKVVMAIPEAALEKGAEVYVSPAMYRQFLAEMVEKNFFHYAGPQNAAPAEIVFPGSDVKIVKTPGLAGANKVVATFAKNLYYGTDMEGDAEDIKLWFSNDDDIFKLKVLWNSGVQIAFPDQVVLGTIA